MIVVDASVLVEVLRRSPEGEAIEERLYRPDESLHAPHLIDVEVAHVLRRFAMRGDFEDARGRGALDDLADMPIWRHPHAWLFHTAWRLRSNVSAYDAMYVALAYALGAPLLTRDGKLASEVGSFIAVELV